MTTKHGKVDANQGDIVKELEKAGCKVLIMSDLGNGAPDLLVCNHGELYLLEVKGAKGKLTDEQVIFHACWPVVVVRTVIQALRECGCVEDETLV
jgi:hypothetical protein